MNAKAVIHIIVFKRSAENIYSFGTLYFFTLLSHYAVSDIVKQKTRSSLTEKHVLVFYLLQSDFSLGFVLRRSADVRKADSATTGSLKSISSFPTSSHISETVLFSHVFFSYLYFAFFDRNDRFYIQQVARSCDRYVQSSSESKVFNRIQACVQPYALFIFSSRLTISSGGRPFFIGTWLPLTVIHRSILSLFLYLFQKSS